MNMHITHLSSAAFFEKKKADDIKRAANSAPVVVTDETNKPAYVFLSYVTYQRLLGPTLRQMVAMPGGDDIEFDPPRLSDEILHVPD
jgi:hypothetical protein